MCIPIKEVNWSILDISVFSDNHSPENGYVHKTQFTPSEISNDTPLDAITKTGQFSPALWSKYFGLYACQNGHGRVPEMYFGHKYIVVGPHELRDDKSCALDILDSQFSQEQGKPFNKKYFTLHSLRTVIHRTNNKEFHGFPIILHNPDLHQLILFNFIH